MEIKAIILTLECDNKIRAFPKKLYIFENTQT